MLPNDYLSKIEINTLLVILNLQWSVINQIQYLKDHQNYIIIGNKLFVNELTNYNFNVYYFGDLSVI